VRGDGSTRSLHAEACMRSFRSQAESGELGKIVIAVECDEARVRLGANVHRAGLRSGAPCGIGRCGRCWMVGASCIDLLRQLGYGWAGRGVHTILLRNTSWLSVEPNMRVQRVVQYLFSQVRKSLAHFKPPFRQRLL